MLHWVRRPWRNYKRGGVKFDQTDRDNERLHGSSDSNEVNCCVKPHTRDMQWHVACFWNRRHVAYELYSNTWWMEHLIIVVGGADSTKVMIRFQIIAPSIVNSAAKPPKIGQRLTMNGLTWPEYVIAGVWRRLQPPPSLNHHLMTSKHTTLSPVRTR